MKKYTSRECVESGGETQHSRFPEWLRYNGGYSNERKKGNKGKFVQPRLLGVKLETRACVEIIEECLVIRCNIKAVTYCDRKVPSETWQAKVTYLVRGKCNRGQCNRNWHLEQTEKIC